MLVMTRDTADYLEELEKTNLKKILAKYDPLSLFYALYKEPEIPAFAIEVLVTAAANMNSFKFGINKQIDENIIRLVINDAAEILSKTTYHSNSFLRYIRGIRPDWFTFPEYYKLLKPFDKDIKDKLGLDLDSINQMVNDAVNSDYKSINFEPIHSIIDDLRVDYSKCKTLADMWEILLIDFEGFTVVLANKLSDILYYKICSKLEAVLPHFGKRKGKALEDYVTTQFTKFMPSFNIIQNYYVDNREKDLLILGKKGGFAIECKAAKIRKSSSDWSVLNAKDDFMPIKDALEQLQESLNILEIGGKIKDSGGIIRKLKPQDIFFGFVVTDQIYTPYIRGILDTIIENPFVDKENEEHDLKWHGKNIWIGSFIDLHFLLEVSQTPSLLLDYFQFMRSKASNKWTDEPEAWIGYACIPSLLPLVQKGDAPIVINKGFKWDVARKEGLNHFIPHWLQRFPEVKILDRKGLNLQALNITQQDRKKAIQSIKEKWKSTPI